MTNAAAIGYMIMAAKRIDLSPWGIKRLEEVMREEMDFTTEEQAELAYYLTQEASQ